MDANDDDDDGPDSPHCRYSPDSNFLSSAEPLQKVLADTFPIPF